MTHTHKLRDVMTTSAILVQAQARPNSGMEKGGGYRMQSLADNLLVIDSFWGRQSLLA